MKTKIIMLCTGLLLFTVTAKAQWVVTDPANLAQGIINTINQIAETSQTVGNTLNSFKEIAKVYEQGKAYYDGLKAVTDLVKDARKVQKTVLMVAEIGELYVEGYQKMIGDDNFTAGELAAIAQGYAILLAESAGLLSDLKTIINPSTLSMSDKERMDLIDNIYSEVLQYRNLVAYYTRKNIGVSWVRAMEKGDTERVLSLYGTSDRYW